MSPSRQYRLRVAKPGETDLSSSTNVDLEFSTTDPTIRFTRLREWGGQRVTGVEAKAESLPWEVGIAESSTGEEVTSKLNQSTVAGPDMMRRTARLDVQRGATGGLSPDAGGRVSDLSVDRETQEWRFKVRDALFKARTAGAFSSNDTQITPRGVSEDWWRLSDAGNVVWEVAEIDASNNTADVRPLRASFNLTPGELEELENDVVGNPEPASTNFRNLKVRDEDAGSTYSVVTFSGGRPNAPLAGLLDSEEGADAGFVRIHTTDYAKGDEFRGIMHAFGRNPSTVLPLHYGGSTGIDPMQFVKDRYDDASVRTPTTLYQQHSTGTRPNAVLDHPLKLDDLYIRVTENTTSLQSYLEDVIFRPHGVAPLIDDEGRVKPTYLRQPDAADIPATTSLKTFTSTNMEQHPTWEQGTNEQVTRLVFDTDLFFESDPFGRGASDRVNERDFRREFTHATTIFGEHSRRVHLHGFNFAPRASERIAEDSFERFGSGPIRSTFPAMSDASTVRSGDFVVIDVPTFPKAPDAVRGGKQIFQVLSRTGTVKGPTLELLELGPEAQPLNSPTVSLAQSSTEPRHAVDITVTNLTTGASAQVQLAAQSAEPGGSSEWVVRDLTMSSGTVTRSKLPSGETIWGQARATKNGRIASGWSTADSANTQAITAPSSLSISSTDPNEAQFDWINGSTAYNTQIRLFSTDHSYHPDPRRVTQRAGSDSAFVSGFGEDHAAGDSIDVQVLHFDRFGGESGASTGTLTLGTTAKASPSVERLTISQGFFPEST